MLLDKIGKRPGIPNINRDTPSTTPERISHEETRKFDKTSSEINGLKEMVLEYKPKKKVIRKVKKS